jgi:hypothetical protein
MSYIVGFAQFWYRFIVGDDWRIAAGVVVAIAVTALIAGTGVPVWWLMPAFVIALLAESVRRAAR